MNKNLPLLLIFLSTFCYSQVEEFTFSEEGFTDYLVIPCKGKTKSELYRSTLNWIKKVYNTPEKVIKAKIENDYIRIQGSSSNLVCFSGFGLSDCNLARYQIEISFKDDKYKFDVTNVEYFTRGFGGAVGNWQTLYLDGTTNYYNRKGKVKTVFKDFIHSFPDFFTNLNIDLNLYIETEKEQSRKDDW